MDIAEAKRLDEKIKKRGGIGLRAVEKNLVDEVWGNDRPARPDEPVIVLDIQYTGKIFGEKIEELRAELAKKKKAGFVICMYQQSLRFNGVVLMMCSDA